MERKFVNSRKIVSVGYDMSIEVLEVEFQDGSIYQYSEISLEVYLAFMIVQGFSEEYFYHDIQGKYPCYRVC